MDRSLIRGCVVACLLGGTTASHAEIKPGDQALVERVAHRLLAVAGSVEGYSWPPEFRVIDNEKMINAWANAEHKGDQCLPKVQVTTGILHQVIQADEDRLAFVLAHELCHITLRHILPDARESEETPLVRSVYDRANELAADRKGLEMVLQAGFSYRQALRTGRRMIDLGLEYSSFEGLDKNHPSWKERLAELDRDQATLWRSMGAFQDGVFLLLCEQYGSAERCFRLASRDFPGCYEAWANLGYTLLMQYCDALDADDLRRFDLGQLAIGGFYRRPESLEAQVRGVDEELWWDAVGALREALRLKPDAVLAKANLGVAYLVRPAGKDVGQATRYLQEASEAAEADASLGPSIRAAVLVNAGVAELAGGRIEAGVRKFDRSGQIERQFLAERSAGAEGNPPTLAAALHYNRARLLASSSRPEERAAAIDLFEAYLRTASPDSAWWLLAYERYAALCQEHGRSAKAASDLRNLPHKIHLRPLVALELDSGIVIPLDVPPAEVEGRLGKAAVVPVVARTNLIRLIYADRGIDVLAADRVLAIRLTGPNSPPLRLRGVGLGAKVRDLHVGMSRKELEEVLSRLECEFRELDNPQIRYRFYLDLGLAVRVQQNRVVELAVVRIPRRSNVLAFQP